MMVPVQMPMGMGGMGMLPIIMQLLGFHMLVTACEGQPVVGGDMISCVSHSWNIKGWMGLEGKAM